MIRMIKSLLPVLALIGLAPLHAQTPTESAKAEGKAFGRTQGTHAQDASTREPDASTVPNFGGVPSQSAYFDDPDSLAPDSGTQSSAHEGYQAMRASANQRARFDPVDLDTTIKRAQEVSADPLNYTSGMTVTGAQGRCVPLPSGNGSAGRYFATCNTGFAATEETRSCSVALNVTVSIQTNYVYWCNESPFNQENGTDDCALYTGPQCRQTGSRPGRCLQWSENGGRPYCVEPGEPISVITCTEPVPSGSSLLI